MQINGQHLAGSKPALGYDIFCCVVVDTYLRGNRDMPVLRNDIPGRPETVSIETTCCIVSVSQDDGGRTIPWLHMAIEKLIKCARVRIEVVPRLPRRRNQDAYRLNNIHAGGTHHLEHVVETR